MVYDIFVLRLYMTEFILISFKALARSDSRNAKFILTDTLTASRFRTVSATTRTSKSFCSHLTATWLETSTPFPSTTSLPKSSPVSMPTTAGQIQLQHNTTDHINRRTKRTVCLIYFRFPCGVRVASVSIRFATN